MSDGYGPVPFNAADAALSEPLSPSSALGRQIVLVGERQEAYYV